MSASALRLAADYLEIDADHSRDPDQSLLREAIEYLRRDAPPWEPDTTQTLEFTFEQREHLTRALLRHKRLIQDYGEPTEPVDELISKLAKTRCSPAGCDYCAPEGSPNENN